MKQRPLSPATALLRIQTLGGFRAWRQGAFVEPAAWGREKAVQLFQFFVTMRRHPLHKEEIIERLWPELDGEQGDRDFKVALNAIYKALEPEREPRAQSQFIRRYELAYALDTSQAWIDADAFEQRIEGGNQALAARFAPESAIPHYQAAVELYAGIYLPERRYEDWTSAERERLQTLGLSTMTRLADMLIERDALESLRLTQRVLGLEPIWEDAYRVQMRAYLAQGNRAMALRTYQQCAEVLQREFALEPLPETQALYKKMATGK